jgi:hypothetical protein
MKVDDLGYIAEPGTLMLMVLGLPGLRVLVRKGSA